MRASRYLGMNRLLGSLAKLLGKDPLVTLGLGLEHEGEPLLTPYCPPYFASMEEAVHAVVEYKFGDSGVFREGVRQGGWRDPESVAQSAQPPSALAIEATVAYCQYIYRRYGRFPPIRRPSAQCSVSRRGTWIRTSTTATTGRGR